MTKIYTDGACIPNPGTGAWGVVIVDGENIETYSGKVNDTTNMRTEIQAAIKGLSRSTSLEVEVISDSKIVLDAFLKRWIYSWVNDNWVGRLNADLWKRLLEYSRAKEITWTWVKGHSGDKYNEMADKLADNLLIDVPGRKEFESKMAYFNNLKKR
ncbi:MAG: ribonuclease H [Pedobacter sp.]|uniref:ribonuclease HI n=1 Tax=Pedobacter sp. TaxID=1411316 RepID=UPI0035664C4B